MKNRFDPRMFQRRGSFLKAIREIPKELTCVPRTFRNYQEKCVKTFEESFEEFKAACAELEELAMRSPEHAPAIERVLAEMNDDLEQQLQRRIN